MEKLVERVDGVARSKASWTRSTLQIWYTPGKVPQPDKIGEAIRKANFTPSERIECDDS